MTDSALCVRYSLDSHGGAVRSVLPYTSPTSFLVVTTADELVLHGTSIFLKYGFDDGDQLRVWVNEYFRFGQKVPEWIFVELIQTFLIPLMEARGDDFALIVSGTRVAASMHNPIRVVEWNKKPVSYRELPEDYQPIVVALTADLIISWITPLLESDEYAAQGE